MRPSVLALITITVAAVSFAHGEDEAADARALQGEWGALDAELGGKEFPDQAIKTMTVEFREAQYISRLGKKADRGTYKLGGSATPKQIDVTIVKGPNSGKTFLGIYSLKNGLLRICFDLGGKDRPKEFDTADKPQRVLVTYKRKKTKG